MTEHEKQEGKEAAPANQAPKKKSNRTLFIILGVIGGLLACIIIVVAAVIGAGFFAARKAINEGEKQLKEMGVEKSGESTYKYKSKEGEAEVGENVDLPKDWPSDVAVYEGKITSASSSKGGKSFWIVIQTKDSADDVNNFYAKEMKDAGWKESSTSNYSGTTSTSYQKDKKTTTVTHSKDSYSGKNNVTISVYSF